VASAATGSVALAAGMLIIVAATSIGSGALYLIGSVVGGAGFGVAFLGALRALSASIPAEHRSSVMSAFYLVAYSSLSLPAILAGVLDTPFGLKPAFETFGTVIAALALGAAIQAWRTRPKRDEKRPGNRELGSNCDMRIIELVDASRSSRTTRRGLRESATDQPLQPRPATDPL
jgi:MFS family permease